MSVVVAFRETGPCRRELTIEVPAPAVAAETGRVIQEYSRQVKIPGFRRGKVPSSVIRQRFHEEIEKEVADRLIPRYWNQAQAEKNLEPLLPPRVEDLQMPSGEPMTFVASVETRPRIELADYRQFELPEGRIEPDDDEVSAVLDDLRREHGEWIPVDRAAARGDLVSGTMRELAGGEGAERKIEVEIGDERVWEELSLALTGLSSGQGGELSRREGSEERSFRVEVEAVKERRPAELDAELAGKLGGYASVEELQEAIADRLRASKAEALQRRREVAVLDQLRERHPVELPTGVVEHETEGLLHEYGASLSRRGVDLEKVEVDWEAVARELRPQAERRVHVRLLLDAIAAAEELRIDEAEFEALLRALAAREGRSALAMRQHLAESGRLDKLRQQMLRDKTVRTLLGEGEPDEPTATAETGAEAGA